MNEGKARQYTVYAVGEILLVVIGILIALQINNWNDARATRNLEITYLKNLKSDLIINNAELDRYMQTRSASIEAATKMLEHFNGKPVIDYDAFNLLPVSIYGWQKFYQSNNTFKDLLNSGNLSLISNESIKNNLMDIESLHIKMKNEEDHYRFDSEQLIYGPLYQNIDLTPVIDNFEYQLSEGQAGHDIQLSAENFQNYLSNTQLKNGFRMTILEFETLNAQMTAIKEKSLHLIELIDEEIAK
jgi:hypothetical protein